MHFVCKMCRIDNEGKTLIKEARGWWYERVRSEGEIAHEGGACSD